MPKFVSDLLTEVSEHPERTDWHQYTRGFGHTRLVNVLANLYSRFLKNPVNPQTDVLVTVGAYLALYYSFLGWLDHGDEVIVMEPAYDSYVPQIKLAGGVPVPVVLSLAPNPTSSADYKLDISAIESKITPKTKMLILNNPHNPTGKLFSREELLALAELVKKHDLIVIADEVYEWHIYPGHEMIRFASLPGMYERTITIGSAGKAFSATGWKLGWALGPAQLLAPLKTIHQNCVFTCSTPTQEALARAFEMDLAIIEEGKFSESHLLTGLASELLPKRDLLAKGLREAGLTPIIPEAGYFMIADFSDI
uniref:Aminotransferase class I/classII domain-containing protein n=1 Tax=Acrobeloides nanus TaxID=290746 RepID=A0A914D9G5_9BILA